MGAARCAPTPHSRSACALPAGSRLPTPRRRAAMTNPLPTLRQQWPPPSAPRPIVVIGAGSIVRDAHLPVYARLGFPVAGIFDVNPAASRAQAEAFGVARVFDSLDAALATRDAIFDVAVPPT